MRIEKGSRERIEKERKENKVIDKREFRRRFEEEEGLKEISLVHKITCFCTHTSYTDTKLITLPFSLRLTQ